MDYTFAKRYGKKNILKILRGTFNRGEFLYFKAVIFKPP